MTSPSSVIKYLIQSKSAISLCLTGGGVSSSSWLLTTPGSSAVVNSVVIPYSRAALIDFLNGVEPTKFCSLETSILLAKRAYYNSAQYSLNEVLSSSVSPLGISCTASLATLGEKRGPHEAFICVYDAAYIQTYHVRLDKKLGRSRVMEDEVVSNVLLHAASKAVAKREGEEGVTTLSHSNNTVGLAPSDSVMETSVPHTDPVLSIANGTCAHGTYVYNKERKETATLLDIPLNDVIVIPGSFNPLHEGHEELARQAKLLVHSIHSQSDSKGGQDVPVVFELSMINVDKPPLSTTEILKRVAQFGAGSISGRVWPVVVSNAPRFSDKVRMFRNCYFVIGVDTALRLVDVKYYNSSIDTMMTALQAMSDNGARFIVAGRVDQRKDAVSKTFLTLKDVKVPRPFLSLFLDLPSFRVDLSSSELRSKFRWQEVLIRSLLGLSRSDGGREGRVSLLQHCTTGRWRFIKNKQNLYRPSLFLQLEFT